MRTVTVSDTNTNDALKDLVASIPLVHENLIKNSVHHLKLLAVKNMLSKKISMTKKRPFLMPEKENKIKNRLMKILIPTIRCTMNLIKKLDRYLTRMFCT